MGGRPVGVKCGLIDLTILLPACRMKPVYAREVARHRRVSKRAMTRILRRLVDARLLYRSGRVHDPFGWYYVPVHVLSFVLRALEQLLGGLKAGLRHVEVDEPP